MNRRHALVTISSFIATPAIARPGINISIRNLMGEILTLRYDGYLSSTEHAAFDNLARDRRQNVSFRMDGALIDSLQGIVKESGRDGTFTLLSGYRTQATNTVLPGAANNSFHLSGQALDISRDDMSITQLSASAAQHVGGLGLYKDNGFIHIDTGPVRRWGGPNHNPRIPIPSLENIAPDMVHDPFKF